MSCLTYVLSGGASVVYTHRPKRAGRIAWPPLTCVSSFFFYIITQKKSELCVPSEKLPLLGNIHTWSLLLLLLTQIKFPASCSSRCNALLLQLCEYRILQVVCLLFACARPFMHYLILKGLQILFLFHPPRNNHMKGFLYCWCFAILMSLCYYLGWDSAV